jgi:hypothetical protein
MGRASESYLVGTVLAVFITCSGWADDKRDVRDQFREHVTCLAYWQIASECLPFFAGEHEQEMRLYFDMLIDTMNDRTSELGIEIQLSKEAQQRFGATTKQSLFRTIGSKCGNFQTLIPTYRDRCAALHKAYNARLDELLRQRRRGR